MNKQIPQISRRRIGSVVILDIKGELVGPWALKARESISSLMSDDIPNLIINLKELGTVDSLGVKAISENLSSDSRNALICGRLSVMEMFERLKALHDIEVFEDENAVIDFFGKEFVSPVDELFEEKREHDRLKTAIPLEFTYTDVTEHQMAFKAIVTDLSRGGLFAEYLDLETFDNASKKIDPYDFKILDLKIKLPGHDYIYAKGKVLRTVISGDQLGLGIEFYEIDPKEQDVIDSFLKL